MENDLCDPGYLRSLLRRHGIEPKRSLGQNFIINPTVCPRMAGELPKGGFALEIGPGPGALTRELAKRMKKVVAVELDERFLPVLEETLAGFDNVTVVHADALELDLGALAEREFGSGERFCAAGNLPYYITSPLVMKLLESGLPLDTVAAMVQKEAARRLCAPECSRECGAVTLAVRYRSVPRVAFDVSAGSFSPMPEVDSSVITFKLLDSPAAAPKSEREMFRVIKAAFSMRRKTALNAVSGGMGREKSEVAEALAKAGIPADARAERISLAQYAALSDALCAD